MALTATERAQIRLYLGYPSQYRYVTPRLESVMDTISNSDPEVEALVRDKLTKIAAIDARIQSESGQGLKRVDDVEFYKGEWMTENFRTANIYVGQLSILLGVPIFSRVFTPQGYLGDTFSAGGLANPSSGGRIPLG